MATLGNGSAGRSGAPAPRFRIDDRAGSRTRSDDLISGHSGRRFVTGAVLTLLAISGTLFLFFARWRAAYHERVAYASIALAPTVDPLAKIVPPNVVRATWVDVVSETHAMLDDLAGSGVLNLEQVGELRADLMARVRGARPETAVRVLLGIWTDIDTRSGLRLRQHYPTLLELAMA